MIMESQTNDSMHTRTAAISLVVSFRTCAYILSLDSVATLSRIRPLNNNSVFFWTFLENMRLLLYILAFHPV